MASDFGGWFQRVFGVMRRSFGQLVLVQVLGWVAIAVVVAIVFGAITGITGLNLGRLARGGTEPSTAGVISIVVLLVAGAVLVGAVYALIQVASAFIAIQGAADRPDGVGEALRYAPARTFPMLGWLVLTALLTIVGFLVLLVPGIYLGVVFGGSLLGVVAVERAGIGRCFTLVNRRFFPTWGRLIIAWLIEMAGSVVLFMATGALAATANDSTSDLVAGIVAAVIQIGGSLVLGVFGVAVSVVTYAELRWHEMPGTSAASLAAEMTR